MYKCTQTLLCTGVQKKNKKKPKPNSSLLIMRNKIHVPNFHSKIVWSSVTVIKIYFWVICVNDFYK